MENLEPQTLKYEENLENLKQTFFSLLDDFKKYYVLSNKNIDVEEYQRFFLDSKTQLQKINKEILLTTNDIQKDILKLNKLVSLLNSKLGTEKELNNELIKLINNLKNSNNSSNTMLEDETFIYNSQYLHNFELMILILIIIFLIVKGLKLSTK